MYNILNYNYSEKSSLGHLLLLAKFYLFAIVHMISYTVAAVTFVPIW